MTQVALLPTRLSTEDIEPFERVEVPDDPGGSECPADFRERIMVDVIHDGAHVPARFLTGPGGPAISAQLPSGYVSERDWGAESVAASLASALHIGAYYRVNIARVLLDFGRFPGITPRAADHMHRFAINYPFSELLTHDQKRDLLEAYYDRISEGMDAAIQDRLIKVAIHTYDERNATTTRRPAVSILTRSYGHQELLESPVQLFDPHFPPELAEVTADRILRARMALTLEEAAIHVADNYPYSLPEGSVEVRAQVWSFFDYVRKRFEKEHPPALSTRRGRRGDDLSPRDRVWAMLLDTNLRSAQSESLRSYLHMFRRPPSGLGDVFREARQEYERIGAFIRGDGGAVVQGWRTAVDRPSAILVEIRKDLVWNFAPDGEPLGPRVDDARLIARLLARSIQSYVIADRAAKAKAMLTRDRRFH